MALFIEVVPDGFGTSFDKLAGNARRDNKSGSGRFDHVRRPVRGIQIKEDTYATLQVMNADLTHTLLHDAAGGASDEDPNATTTSPDGFTNFYSNFLIQNVSEHRAEKQQVVVTFGEPYIFFFGEQPRFLQVRGVLLNTQDFNWRAEWWENYDKFLRGTQCVKTKARVYLSWDDIVVEGYISEADAVDVAGERNFVEFSFQMFVTNYQNISNIGDPLAMVTDITPLDPTEIDTITTGSPRFQSSAAIVRAANVKAQANQKGLLATLRDGNVLSALSGGFSVLSGAEDQLQTIIDRASSFVAGRNIRVPVGFAGVAAFDAVQEISLSSLDPSSFNGNQVRVKASFGGKPFVISAQIGAAAIPVPADRYGPLYKNTDEFVARGVPGGPQPEPMDLFAAQRGDDFVAQSVVKQTFKAFGVDTEPPSEVMRLIGKVGFGVVAFVGANQLGSASTQFGQKMNTFVPQPAAIGLAVI